MTRYTQRNMYAAAQSFMMHALTAMTRDRIECMSSGLGL